MEKLKIIMAKAWKFATKLRASGKCLSEMTERLTWMIVRLFFGAGALGLMVVGTFQLITEKPTAGIATITASVVLLLISRMESLDGFKILGVEAKHREVKDAISAADDVIKRIRSTTITACKAAAKLNSLGWRSGKEDDVRKSRAEVLDIIKQLKEVEVGDDEIRNDVFKPWIQGQFMHIYQRIYFDYMNCLRKIFYSVEKVPQDEDRIAFVEWERANSTKIFSIADADGMHAQLAMILESFNHPAAMDEKLKVIRESEMWVIEIKECMRILDYAAPEKWISALGKTIPR